MCVKAFQVHAIHLRSFLSVCVCVREVCQWLKILAEHLMSLGGFSTKAVPVLFHLCVLDFFPLSQEHFVTLPLV